VGQRHIKLAGELRVAALLVPLHAIPQGLPIGKPGSTAGWGKNLGVHHSLSTREVGDNSPALVDQTLAGTICGRGNGGSAVGSPDNLH